MKYKRKYYVIAVFILFAVLVPLGVLRLLPNNEQNVRGHIEIFVNNDVYDYMVDCANKFMELNDKTTITISKVSNAIENIEEQENKSILLSKAKIVDINRIDYNETDINKLKIYDGYEIILDTYKKNFSSYRINQIKIDDNVIGIPLTSRPLALYVRDDMLKTYGYKKDNFNTWDDIIEIGKTIYEKSDKKVRIINATGQDYNDLVDLLIMQNLNYETVDKIKEVVENKIKELKDNNILNLEEGGEFLARISSINAMKEIAALDVPCQWSCIDVPASKFGANKFFASEGDNLIILNKNEDNKYLIQKFITYVITNNKDVIEYVKKGDFFSSYLYTYKSKSIEDGVKNFSEKSPLVVLSNIEEKAPSIEEYDKYLEVKTQLRMN